MRQSNFEVGKVGMYYNMKLHCAELSAEYQSFKFLFFYYYFHYTVYYTIIIKIHFLRYQAKWYGI